MICNKYSNVYFHLIKHDYKMFKANFWNVAKKKFQISWIPMATIWANKLGYAKCSFVRNWFYWLYNVCQNKQNIRSKAGNKKKHLSANCWLTCLLGHRLRNVEINLWMGILMENLWRLWQWRKLFLLEREKPVRQWDECSLVFIQKKNSFHLQLSALE